MSKQVPPAMPSLADVKARPQPSEQPSPEEISGHVDCLSKFDELWACYTPPHQFSMYYQYGLADDCLPALKVWYDCMKLKMTKPSEVRRILRERREAQLQSAPDRAPLWRMRTEPPEHFGWADAFRRQKQQEAGEAGSSSNS